MALVFEKPSTRTRLAFECALLEEGGAAITLSPHDTLMGIRESVADGARTLSQFCSAVAYRGNDHARIEQCAAALTVPLYNALSNLWHPTQAIADMLTVWECFKKLEGVRVCFLGDANSNVARSLALACAMVGAPITVGSPKRYWADEGAQECFRAAVAHGRGRTEGARLPIPRYTEDPSEALYKAQVVYTDVWVSMGDEAQARQRLEYMKPYQVNAAALAGSDPHAIFLHCLPARRGEEVTDEVIDGPRTRVWQQAANRAHTIKALLLATL